MMFKVVVLLLVLSMNAVANPFDEFAPIQMVISADEFSASTKTHPHWKLYRENIFDSELKIYIAHFDNAEESARYNFINCRDTAMVYREKNPGVNYWCE